MDLLKSEQSAVDFINKYGAERANRVLDALCRRFEMRYELASQNSFGPLNREWIYTTKIERELTYLIKIGLSLTDTYNTPENARRRILDRINKRNADRVERVARKSNSYLLL